MSTSFDLSLTAKLHVAIYNDEGVYKHWSLFIEGPTDEELTILNIMGSSTRYYFEMRKSDARIDERLSEVIYLCDLPVSSIDIIKGIAQNAPIHNQYPGYNCQDYVIELLEDLEQKGIIDGQNSDYKKTKDIVKHKQEGLV